MAAITLPPATEVLAFAAGQAWEKCTSASLILAKLGLEPLWVTKSEAPAPLAAGDLVVSKSSKPNIRMFNSVARQLGLETVAVTTPSPIEALCITPLKVAVYGGGGAPFNHAACLGELGFDVHFISPEEIHGGKLSGFHAVVVPGGGDLAMLGQLKPLGERGCLAIQRFVADGGMYIGSCAGSFDAALTGDEFLRDCPYQRHLRMINAAVWNSGNDPMGLASPGVGVIRSRIADRDHPVTAGLPAEIDMSHYNGPFFRLESGAVAGATDAVGLTMVVGARQDFTAAEKFLTSEVLPQPLLIEKACAASVFNTVAGSFGKGRVVLFGSHPEFGLSLDLDKFGLPTRMLANALLWQASHSERHSLKTPDAANNKVNTPLPQRERIMRGVDDSVGLARKLLGRGEPRGNWLDENLAMSTFGASSPKIWAHALAGFATVAARMRGSLDDLAELISDAGDALKLNNARSAAGLREALRDFDNAIVHRVLPEAERDYGYEGLIELLDHTRSLLSRADAAFDVHLQPHPDPYHYSSQSPFMLVAGSYLSAIGLFTSAHLLLRLHHSQISDALVVVRAEEPGRGKF